MRLAGRPRVLPLAVTSSGVGDRLALAAMRLEEIREFLHLQRPDLKLLRRNAPLVTLREGDFIEKPICAAHVRDMLRPVREQ